MDPVVKPQLRLLSEEHIRFIHDRTLTILGRVGVRVDSPRALEVLLATDGVTKAPDSDDEGRRVVFHPAAVERALETAPKVVPVYDRRGQPAFRVGEDRTRFGVGATNLFFQDPITEELSRFTREHQAVAARLAHALPNYDMVCTVGVVQDYPSNSADLYSTLELLANTTKPLLLLVSNEDLLEPALDLAEKLHPDLQDKPFLIPYLNPVTPLVMNRGTAEKLMITVERGLPVIYSNLGMAGMSTPITAAGMLALLNAELMAGLVLAQATRPGAQVILGSLPSFFDMRTLQDFFDPHSFLVNQACAEMMAHYGIPHAGTSGCGIGWGADLAAAGDLWMNHLLSVIGRAGIAPFVSGTLGSKAFSPVLTVYSDDVIGQVVRLSEGFPIGDPEMDLDWIVEQGPGGSFLTSPLTMESYRGAYYESRLSPRIGLEEWQERGRPRHEDLLREHTRELMEGPTLLDDHHDLVGRGEAFIKALGLA